MTEEEFTRRVTEMTDDIYRVSAGLLRRHHDRQDAAQEAIFKAWRALPRLRDETRFRPWLMRIVVNECRAAYRAGRRETPGDIPEAPDPRDEYERTLRDETLHAAMRALPEKIRLTLILYYMDGFSEKDIARTLRVPQGTVASRLHQGRKLLKTMLNREV